MLICAFCSRPIHFYEDFWAVEGRFFHVAVITPDAVRCKQMLRLPRLEKLEKDLLEAKHAPH